MEALNNILIQINIFDLQNDRIVLHSYMESKSLLNCLKSIMYGKPRERVIFV